MLCYEEFIKKINKFSSIGFLISYHFPNQKLYKKYCKSDGFDQVINGIKNLVRHKYNFTVNTVVMKPNMHYLGEMVEKLKRIGVKNIQYRFIDGRNILNESGKNEYKKFVPKYLEVVEIIKKTIEQNKDININLNEFPVCIIGEDLINNLAPSMNPERENLSLGNKVFMSDEIMDRQFVFPNCEKCLYRSVCKGVRREYYKIYGDKEIKPIIKIK
jgi:MoaA/NifB/PqqE/SkfB family radical SAM enzyme